MSYRFHICDVFTERRFGGNPLAVLPDARGLTGEQMQQIAREFNFSETTFVLPPEQGATRRVRIFTPGREVPFAGHPNIGTAFVLAKRGELGEIDRAVTVAFEEAAGLVEVRIEPGVQGALSCELSAPQGLMLGPSVSLQTAAGILSLPTAAIVTAVHPPQVAGVGLPFVIVELASLDALKAACYDPRAQDELTERDIMPDILLYTREAQGCDIRARMFAPMDGVAEDPATGSANCALAALLTHCDESPQGEFAWHIVQGVEMGRPSTLLARTRKQDGKVTQTCIGGSSVMVAEGRISV
jgi:trans-2,3-dihydro-3-hydroxyanthranilate isomerase